MSSLSLSLLGPFTVSLNKRLLTEFRTKGVRALLAYLVCKPNQAHQRNDLMTLLWSEVPHSSAQTKLRQTLNHLRGLIPKVAAEHGDGTVQFLLADSETVQINPAAAYELDVAIFTQLTSSDPERAVALYRGDFLAGFYLAGGRLFQEWATGVREDLRDQMLETLAGLTATLMAEDKIEAAVAHAQRQLEMDNLRESAHRQLIELLARSGRRPAALAHYESLLALLQEKLGLQPSAETEALVEAIHGGAYDQLAGSADGIDVRAG